MTNNSGCGMHILCPKIKMSAWRQSPRVKILTENIKFLCCMKRHMFFVLLYDQEMKLDMDVVFDFNQHCYLVTYAYTNFKLIICKNWIVKQKHATV